MKRPEGFDRAVPPPEPSAKSRRVSGPKQDASESKARKPKDQKPKALGPKARRPKNPGPGPREPGAPSRGPSARAVSVEASPAPSAKAPSRAPTRGRKELRAAARERRRYEKSEIRRFTRRTRNRRLGWLVAGGTVVALGGLLAVAVYSPLLALREITVDGTAAVSAEEVREAVDGQLGVPLALLDYGRIRSELDGFPLIRSYVTEVVPPHELRIHIVERAPLGVVASGGGYQLVDAAGVVLSSAGSRPADLPLLEFGTSDTDGVAFRAIVEVLLALPSEVRATVDSARAGSRDDVTLLLAGSGQQVVWGSAEQSALKARVLQELLATQPASARVIYDVSAPLSPVVRSR